VRHIISIRDFERRDLDHLLHRAGEFAGGGFDRDLLAGKILSLLFFEPSTRTRMSFASAMARLGGTCISVDSMEASSIAKGETLADTVRVVSGYTDAIVLRHPKEGAARLASEFATVPVINAGDGAGQHPSQTLLDLYTIKQSMDLDDIEVGILGDLRYGRTAHSLAYALSLYEVNLHAIAPKGLEFPEGLPTSSGEGAWRCGTTTTCGRSSGTWTFSTSPGSRRSGSPTSAPTTTSPPATVSPPRPSRG
jgi:aspartate carbamoyltransferase catalytic subunit